MSIQTQLVLAQMTADHYQRAAEMQTRMLAEFSELAWRVILELGLPPEAEPKAPVLFGSWSVDTIVAELHRLREKELAEARVEDGSPLAALGGVSWEPLDPTEGGS